VSLLLLLIGAGNEEGGPGFQEGRSLWEINLRDQEDIMTLLAAVLELL
jgi:hypothetical protein